MALTATPSRRRLAMIALLLLAVAGLIIRSLAPEPSTLRDIGTLLLVLWLPAVGNLIAYLIRKIPRRAPPAIDFAPDAAFAPHLQVRMEAVAAAAAALAAQDRLDARCVVLVGRQGFTARLSRPVAQALAAPGPQTLQLQLLHPGIALPRLAAGTEFHLLAGTTAVAKGRVENALETAAS
jgi:hypothetical protein